MPNFVDPLRIKSGSTEVEICSTARVFKNVTFQDITFGSGVADTVETGSSGINLKNHGLSFVSATTGAPQVYTLAAPSAGIEKAIYCTFASSSDIVTVSATTAVAIGEITTTNAYRKIVFGSPGVVKLLGLTTARWTVLSVGTTGTGTTSLPTFTT